MKARVLKSLLCLVVMASVCDCSHAVGKITVDPNAGRAATVEAEAKPDARLAQKVTYEARYRSVQQIVDDLSAMTGIKLYAGANRSDWPVRARKMNIFVKDVSVADLMNSIAHAMKFRWSRNDEKDPPTYRLMIDKKAAVAADALKARGDRQSEEAWRKRRQDWIDAIEKYGSLSPTEFGPLRDTDPVAFDYGRRGAIRSLSALFREVPETKERYATGQSFRIQADKLTPETKGFLFFAGDELWKYLQRIGVVGKATKDPPGYDGLVKSDDRFDIVFGRLDVESFTPNLRWGSASQGSTGYFRVEKGARDFEIADLPCRDSDRERFRSIAHNWITDGEDREHAWDSGSDYHSNPAEDRRKAEELLYPSEPLNDHGDFAELAKTIKIKVDAPKSDRNPVLDANEYVASFQKALADATGLGIVSDSWVNIEGDKLPDQEAKLGELLDRFSKQFNYNWDKHSGILEFRHRKWWKNRLNQIPDDWIAVWSENTRKNGMLSLNDLAAISNLNYYQAEESLKSDKVLGRAGIYGEILRILDHNGDLHWLRLYSTLSPQLRDLLAVRGINGHMLTADQWKQAQTIFDRIGSSRSDAIFRMEHSDSFDRYTFREIDNETGELDREWVVRLPKYEPPPSEANAKH